jgi:hypothetical protein
MRTMLLRRPLFHAFLLTCSHDTRSPTGMYWQHCARAYVSSCMYIRCWRNHLLRVFLRKKWQRHRAFMWKCLLFRCSPFDGQLWSWIDTNNCVSSTPGAVFSCVYVLPRGLLKREVQTCWNSTVGALQLWSSLPISRVSLKVVCSRNAATQGGICFLAPHAHLISCVR